MPWSTTSIDNTKEPAYLHSDIPNTDDDFVPIKDQPMTSEFHTRVNLDDIEDDAHIATVWQKQIFLLTDHDRLSHICFSVLKLMARCGLIPKNLSNDGAPTYPSFA